MARTSPSRVLVIIPSMLCELNPRGIETRKAEPMWQSLFFFFTAIALLLGIAVPDRVSAECVEAADEIVAWWNFDETSGTTATDRIGGFDGAYRNGPASDEGKVGKALQFNSGGRQYLAVEDNDAWAFGRSDFTIEFWANFDTIGGGSVGRPGDVFHRARRRERYEKQVVLRARRGSSELPRQRSGGRKPLLSPRPFHAGYRRLVPTWPSRDSETSTRST